MPCNHVITICNILCRLLQKVIGEAGRLQATATYQRFPLPFHVQSGWSEKFFVELQKWSLNLQNLSLNFFPHTEGGGIPAECWRDGDGIFVISASSLHSSAWSPFHARRNAARPPLEAALLFCPINDLHSRSMIATGRAEIEVTEKTSHIDYFLTITLFYDWDSRPQL